MTSTCPDVRNEFEYGAKTQFEDYVFRVFYKRLKLEIIWPPITAAKQGYTPKAATPWKHEMSKKVRGAFLLERRTGNRFGYNGMFDVRII